MRPQLLAVLDEVIGALGQWQDFALKANVGDAEQNGIAKAIDLQLGQV